LQPLGGQGTPNYWKYGDYTKAKITTSSNLACNKKYSGYWCAAFIINEGWTIGADYPWK
jgi:hypothetical protein